MARTLYRDSEALFSVKVPSFDLDDLLLPGIIFFVVLFGTKGNFSSSGKHLGFTGLSLGNLLVLATAPVFDPENLLLHRLTITFAAGVH